MYAYVSSDATMYFLKDGEVSEGALTGGSHMYYMYNNYVCCLSRQTQLLECSYHRTAPHCEVKIAHTGSCRRCYPHAQIYIIS